MCSLPKLLRAARRYGADRPPNAQIGPDRRDPDRASLYLFLEPRAFSAQLSLQGLDIVNQSK
jgi:hypothetical protein